MERQKLLRQLTLMNTWWKKEEVPPSLLKSRNRRSDFHIYSDKLLEDIKPVMAIHGPRQVGKTTVIGQLIKWLLDERNVNPRRILYLTADNSQIASTPEGVIEDSLDIYESSFLGTSFRNLEETAYIFIDEIQKIPDWSGKLKYYVDQFTNLQFIVSGSISTLIGKGGRETLRGRIRAFQMMPFKFSDYVKYHWSDEDESIEETRDGWKLRCSLEDALKEKDRSEFYTQMGVCYGSLSDREPEFKQIKNDYLLKGGYPEALDRDLSEAFSSLDENLRTTVKREIPDVFEVGMPRKLLGLVGLLAESTTSKTNIKKLAETLEIDRDTVESYLNYLEEFYLVNRVPSFAKSEYRAGKKQDKLYLQDVGLYHVQRGTMVKETLRDTQEMGRALETSVCDHARRLQFHLSRNQNADIYYWDKEGEVDFVLKGPDYLLPIEVKYGDSKNDVRGLRSFLDSEGGELGLAVNGRGRYEQEGDILHIPDWIFLFMC